MIRLDFYDRLMLGTVALASAATAIVYSHLPDPMPIHFDVTGTVDGWAPRVIGAWLMPVVCLAVFAVVRACPHLVSGRMKERLARSPLGAFGFLTVGFLASMHLVVLHASLHPGVSVARAVALLLGGMFVVMGLMMPRVRQNPVFGIRTKWTLSSAENWLRTHRVAGIVMVAGGLVAIAAGLASNRHALAVAIPAVLLASLVPVVYSWRLAQRLPPDRG